MSTPRFVVSFRSASLFVEVDATEFARASAALEPFMADQAAADPDDYAKVAQSVDGQEYSFEAAKAAGLFDSEGDPAEGVEVFQAE
jgi:hypothetical protein